MIRCRYCPRVTLLDEPGARFLGWRLYSGISLTGKQIDDVICPKCSGRGTVGDEELIPSWDMKCLRCGWRFSDEWTSSDFVPVISASEALLVAGYHKCDPVFEFIDQGGKKYTQDNMSEIV